MPIEFAERIRRIPVYPAADGYALPGDVALLFEHHPQVRTHGVIDHASSSLLPPLGPASRSPGPVDGT